MTRLRCLGCGAVFATEVTHCSECGEAVVAVKPAALPGSGPLIMWTIYEHPLDWPGWYVARPYKIEGPEPVPGDKVLLDRQLEPLRQAMRDMGLVCLARNEEDDPNIVETWL